MAVTREQLKEKFGLTDHDMRVTELLTHLVPTDISKEEWEAASEILGHFARAKDVRALPALTRLSKSFPHNGIGR